MSKFANLKILPGSYRHPAALLLPAADKNQAKTISLQLRRRRALPELHPDMPFLSREELESEYGASDEDLDLISSFADAMNLSVVSVDRAKRLVKLSGLVADFNRVFQTSVRQITAFAGDLHTRGGPLFVPEVLLGVVTGIFGLSNRPLAIPHVLKSRAFLPSPVKPAAFDGVQLASIYNFPPATGMRQTIGIIELGGGYDLIELDMFFSSLGLPTPKLVDVSVNGGLNHPFVDMGADTEVALDVEVAGAVAPESKIAVYFAPNTGQSFIEAVLAAIHDRVNNPSVLSISWGAAEVSWTQQEILAMNDAFHAAALVGMSVFAAAGDDGANDNVSDGRAHVDFPASSPFVTACGGTRLIVQDGGRTETVWNAGDGSATGGGISNFFARPEYQTGITVPQNLSTSFQGRGVPDVAAVADPQTGYATLVHGLWYVVGGTSAVAPLYAGLQARINELRGKSAGLINLSIYAQGGGKAFSDVTEGNNSCDGIAGYKASIGWDPVTGFGSPDGTALFDLLAGENKAQAA